jgi:gliding motility-associated-like protein
MNFGRVYSLQSCSPKKNFSDSHLKSETFNFKFLTPSFLLPFVFLSSTVAFSQINFVNNGQSIVNNNPIFVIVGNIIHQNNGSIANSGNFYITGDCINNNPTGNVFTAGNNGWVYLSGATQTISGSTLTHFNKLGLSGSGTKQLSDIDTEIEDTLSLSDREFAAGNNTVFITSVDTGVIARNTGFISSTGNGGLARNTLFAGAYLFPVGSNDGTPRYRPVEIVPNSSAGNTFKVGMINIDATDEGYDRSVKENTLGQINPSFFHKINRTNGFSSADITLYFDNILDGDFELMAQWTGAQWKNLGTVTKINNYAFSGLKKKAVADFSNDAFVLSEIVPSVFVANVFSPNNDGINDVLHVMGKGIAELRFTIYDRWGERVFETTDLNGSWDGNYQGEPMNSGVFVYFVNGKLKNGENLIETGNVTLLR